MATSWTDTNLPGNIKIKGSHITEINNSVKALATQAKKTSETSITNLSGISASTSSTRTKANVELLRSAVNRLQELFSGNCCQAQCVDDQWRTRYLDCSVTQCSGQCHQCSNGSYWDYQCSVCDYPQCVNGCRSNCYNCSQCYTE